MKYLLQFLIGSSVFVFFWFFNFVHKRINDKKSSASYFNYSLGMPIIFGIYNVLGKVIQDYTNISDLYRYLLISTISYLLLMFNLLFLWDIYEYNTYEWILHAFIAFIAYTGAFTCIMNVLEKIILKKTWENGEKKFVYGLSIIFIIVFLYTAILQK